MTCLMQYRNAFSLFTNSILKAATVCAALHAAQPVHAQQRYEPSTTVEKHIEHYVVERSGAYRVTLERALRVVKPQGISAAGKVSIYYIESKDEVEAFEAWNVLPDGTRIQVPPEAIRTQDEERDEDEDSSDFSDNKQRTAIYPKVEVGSVLHSKAQTYRHTPEYAGHFMLSARFVPTARWNYLEYRVTAPADMQLHFKSRGMRGGLIKTEAGLNHYAFTLLKTEVEAPDNGLVSYWDFAPTLHVSTLPDMVAVGRLYQDAARAKAAITPRIAELAKKLTANIKDERARVKTLHHWVAKNIRYVSVSLADGRLVPRPADSVLENRYGDCKDHVVLLEAMLAAIGISSSPALINSGDAYQLNQVGVVSPMNHVITYIPSLDMYLDSTDQFAPMGTLSFELMDKPTVLTALNRLGHTPKMHPSTEQRLTEAQLDIQPDGSIVGTSVAHVKGIAEPSSRRRRFNARQSGDEDVVRRLLERFNETGTGSLDFPPPEDLDQPFVVKAKFKLEPVSNMPGRGAFKIPVGLAPGSIASINVSNLKETITANYPCASYTINERYRISFPTSVTIENIPETLQYTDNKIQYLSTYTLLGQEVISHRKLSVERASNVCTPEDHLVWRKFITALKRDLRAQIFYK